MTPFPITIPNEESMYVLPTKIESVRKITVYGTVKTEIVMESGASYRTDEPVPSFKQRWHDALQSSVLPLS
jgi:hypothetical protein